MRKSAIPKCLSDTFVTTSINDKKTFKLLIIIIMRTENFDLSPKVSLKEFEIERILDYCKDTQSNIYPAGQHIYEENQTSDNVYYLQEGKAKIVKKSLNGQSRIIRFLSEGDLFGIRSLLTTGKHQTSAIALENTVICSIPKASFHQIVKEEPSFSLCIFKHLSALIYELEGRNNTLMTKSELERLAKHLVFLHNKYESDTIQIPKQDLASFSNIEKKSLNSHLHGLKEKNLIAFNSERIKIKNVNALKAIADV